MSASCTTNEKPNGRYGLIVIGAGSAGFSAAITASEQGANVALIGHGTIGGTCVNVGCVPSKTIIRVAEALHGARAAARFAGITGEAHVESWSRVIAAKDDLVGQADHCGDIGDRPAEMSGTHGPAAKWHRRTFLGGGVRPYPEAFSPIPARRCAALTTIRSASVAPSA